MKHVTFIVLFSLLPLFPVLASTPTVDRHVAATRIEGEVPRIDGYLDDEIWQRIPAVVDFVQYEPIEGAAPSEETRVQIAYDQEALYIAVRCLDQSAADIVSRLVRRDAESEADWVKISLDPHLDRQTGRFFGVYASGSVADGIYANDRDEDDTWNGVWQVKTRIDANGWVAEFRIPYYVLRFSPREEYVWGLNIERYISRKREHLHWNLMAKGEPRPCFAVWLSRGHPRHRSTAASRIHALCHGPGHRRWRKRLFCQRRCRYPLRHYV